MKKDNPNKVANYLNNGEAKDPQYFLITEINNVAKYENGVIYIFTDGKWKLNDGKHNANRLPGYNKDSSYSDSISDFKEITKEQAFLDVALSLATMAHKDQLDKAGVDYILHPIKVSSLCNNNDEKIVALLHDVIEDSPTTLNDLRQAGFEDSIIEAVDILTKKEGTDYEDYLKLVKENEITRVVKIADLTHNSDLSRLSVVTNSDQERIQKYKRALDFLRQE